MVRSKERGRTSSSALARLWEDRVAVPSAAPVLVIHDEIVIEVNAEEADAAADWLRRHMEAAGREVISEIPIVVEAAVVSDWIGTAAVDVMAPTVEGTSEPTADSVVVL